jgi:hypothetical protein
MFVIDLAQEYLRTVFFKNGSDYVRILLKNKNRDDEYNTQVEVTEEDVSKIKEFLVPIQAHY